MTTIFDSRRSLSDFDPTRTGNIVTDVLVIGSGVAGVCSAIAASEFGLVTLMTKGAFEESATAYAQGGIAAALGDDDSPQLHIDDTLRVGCGLCDSQAVELLAKEAPHRIAELIDWGIAVDRKGDRIALGREGGHAVHRIVHARGDQTGAELVRTLHEKVRRTPGIRVFEHCFLIDLLTDGGECVGASTFHVKYGHQLIWARQTVLASGGAGQLWRETTNPATATGDGLAAAFRAGARMRDLELMQFHPTTLYVAGAGRALISEAVRGEGARLIDRAGDRFMIGVHPDLELAPRDIVSRAIHEHLQKTRANCVYLDVSKIPDFVDRFPQVARLCRQFKIDPPTSLIPVRPSAHYLIGGVEVDLDGRTSVPNLCCVGEAASSGVHGANRLASNSLLEGLVFGKRVGEAAGAALQRAPLAGAVRRIRSQNPESQRTVLDLADILNSLRSLMWRNVGITRSGDRLDETLEILDFWGRYTLDKTFDGPEGWQAQNELTLAFLTAQCAAQRKESRGVHFRTDFPETASQAYHVVTTIGVGAAAPFCVAWRSGGDQQSGSGNGQNSSHTPSP